MMSRRKHDAHKDEVEGVAQRLRSERPEASPLELDRIKTTAMSRARSAARGRAGARRLAVAGLTVGLLAAMTGGVIAGVGSSHSPGNAAVAQYGNNCDTNNGGNSVGSNNGNGNSKSYGHHHSGHGSSGGGGNNNGNGNGNESGNGNNNYNCNENSFNETVNNYAGSTTNITNNYTTVSATPSVGVLGSKTKKPSTSSRHIKIHVKVPHGLKLRKVTVRVNGKRVKTLTGKKASANVELVNLPCSKGTTKVAISVTLSNGKTITSRHQYHLCV
jgi:hypothetical protein